MRIPKDEQETTFVFDAALGKWDIYTCVPAHIQLFMRNERRINADIEVLTSWEGKATSIRFSIENSAISIRSFFKKKRIKRKPSEAQLQARQNFAEMVRSK